MKRNYGCGNPYHTTGYWGKYDMFGCVECDKWTEDFCGCDEEECHFLKAPAKPSLSEYDPELFKKQDLYDYFEEHKNTICSQTDSEYGILTENGVIFQSNSYKEASKFSRKLYEEHVFFKTDLTFYEWSGV